MVSKVIILVVLAVCAVVSGQVHEWGRREHGDLPVHNQFIKVDSKIGRKVVEEVNYPNGTNLYPGRNINYIRVVDQKSRGHESEVTLKYGGINYPSAGIKIKSKRNHGIKCTVEIYAR